MLFLDVLMCLNVKGDYLIVVDKFVDIDSFL